MCNRHRRKWGQSAHQHLHHSERLLLRLAQLAHIGLELQLRGLNAGLNVHLLPLSIHNPLLADLYPSKTLLSALVGLDKAKVDLSRRLLMLLPDVLDVGSLLPTELLHLTLKISNQNLGPALCVVLGTCEGGGEAW